MADITGATSDFYRPTVTTSDAGDYSVKISNAAGSVFSANATVTVVVPPAITQQPNSVTANLGNNVTFTVKATGTAPLSYQWFENDDPMPGETGSSLTVHNVQPADDQNSYYVNVANAADGYDINSDSVLLTVLVPPIIDNQPYFDDDSTNTTAVVGDDVTISVDISPDSTDDSDYPYPVSSDLPMAQERS